MIPKAVDIVCDEFESGLRRGQAPRIEELLSSNAPEYRSRLLYELLVLEVEYRVKHDQITYLDELRHRFPDDLDTLSRVFRSFLWEGSGFVGSVDQLNLMLCRFRLKAIVGRGGFGTVWLADDTRLEREVAIKTPHAYAGQRTNGSQAALLEAAAAAKLRHPHLLPVHEVAEIDGRWFMVTDFVSGGTLKQYLKSQSLTCVDVAKLGTQLADALHHAHSHGIHHRDLKPSNILVDERGQLLIADFGLAATARRGMEHSEGLICGTQAYMAPEQSEGRYGGERADIYSLGVILEDLLEAATTSVSVVPGSRPAREKGTPTNRLVTRALGRIRDKCCHVDPVQRYPSADALARDLSRVASGKPPRAVGTSRKEMVRWFIASHWKLLILSLLLAISLGGLAMSGGTSPHPDARRVQFSTDPPGCKIAVVPLDAKTGDPIPERLEHGGRVSPVEMQLLPGDYLVVAVKDGHAFHEVIRHVPARSEQIPFIHPHRAWRMNKGLIELPEIRVRDLPSRIALVPVMDAANVLVASPNSPADLAERLRIPGFYAAMTAISRQSILLSHGDTEDSPRTKKTLYNHDTAIAMAEHEGLRLPSAAEYASMLAQQEELVARGMIGLDDEVGEWTTSRPGASGTGIVPPIPSSDEAHQVIIMGLGASTDVNAWGEEVMHPRVEKRLSRQQHLDLASRPVRSSKPRTSPEDFVKSAPAIVRYPESITR